MFRVKAEVKNKDEKIGKVKQRSVKKDEMQKNQQR